MELSVKKNLTPFFLILDGISDVRNFGAIARSAECAGAAGLVVPAKGGANINADAIKTSAGALLRLPVARVANIREAIFFFKQNNVLVYSASEKADATIFETDFKKPVAVVLGSEDKGVSKSALSYSDAHLRIPMKGDVSSLNVSAAASVICFEVVRQRGDF
jgi:23S rRNA (guanosine2251-2'-O)-methyltransferase